MQYSPAISSRSWVILHLSFLQNSPCVHGLSRLSSSDVQDMLSALLPKGKQLPNVCNRYNRHARVQCCSAVCSNALLLRAEYGVRAPQNGPLKAGPALARRCLSHHCMMASQQSDEAHPVEDRELAAFGMPCVPWTLMSLALPCACSSGHPVFRQRPPFAAQALNPPASLQMH